MNSQEIRDIILMYEAVYNGELREKANEYNNIKELNEDLQSTVERGLNVAAKNPIVKAIGSVIAPVGKGRKTPTATSGGYRPVKEESKIDLFDYLLEYLVAEGYADTNQDALVIMANMTQDEINNFIIERRREDKGEPRKERDPAMEVIRSMPNIRKGLMTRSGNTVAKHERERGISEKDRPQKPEQTTADRLQIRKERAKAAEAASRRREEEEQRRRRLN